MEKKKIPIEWRYFWGAFVGYFLWSVVAVLVTGEAATLLFVMLPASAFMALCLVVLPIWLARRSVNHGNDDAVLAAFIPISIEFLVIIGVQILSNPMRDFSRIDWQSFIPYCILWGVALIGANQAKKEIAAQAAAVPLEAAPSEVPAVPVVELPETVDGPPLPAIEPPAEQPVANSYRTAIYALSAMCGVLLITAVTLGIDDKKNYNAAISLAAQNADMQAEIASLTIEKGEYEKEAASVQERLDQTRTSYNDALTRINRLNHVILFYYDYSGVLDGEGQVYYHRYGCDCPIFDTQGSCYIYNIENMPSRSKPCPYCYSRKADLPINSASYKY